MCYRVDRPNVTHMVGRDWYVIFSTESYIRVHLNQHVTFRTKFEVYFKMLRNKIELYFVLQMKHNNHDRIKNLIFINHCINPVGSRKCFWLLAFIPNLIQCFCWIFRMNLISRAFLEVTKACQLHRQIMVYFFNCIRFQTH